MTRTKGSYSYGMETEERLLFLVSPNPHTTYYFWKLLEEWMPKIAFVTTKRILETLATKGLIIKTGEDEWMRITLPQVATMDIDEEINRLTGNDI